MTTNLAAATIKANVLGATASRTLGDRFAEIKNVVDFGADPSGSSDSKTAIQNAINWTSDPNRGTIFFPKGTYSVSSSISLNGASINDNLSIRLLGVGSGSFVQGQPGFDGYIFDRSSGTPNNTTGLRIFEGLAIQNPGTSPNFKGGGIRIGSSNGVYIRDCTMACYICVTTEDSVGVSSQNILIEDCSFATQGAATGAHCVIVGGAGAMMGCDSRNADIGVRVYGTGFQLMGCRQEVSNVGYIFGLDSGGNNVGASGFSVASCGLEGNTTGFWLAGTCSGFLLTHSSYLGHDAGNSGFPRPPGSNGLYGIRLGPNCSGGAVIAASIGQWVDGAGIYIESASSRANIVIMGCNPIVGAGTGTAWSLPGNAYTAQFINCNTNPIWTFSQLPTSTNRFEGDEFDISDSTTATWGATVSAGGGSNRVRVRYNNSVWTVVGK